MRFSKLSYLIISIITILILAACGSSETSSNTTESDSSSSTNDSADGLNLAVGGSTSGSTAFAYSVAIGNIVGDKTGNIQMQIQETTGTVDGVRQLFEGGVDIAVSTSGTTIDALRGVGPFEMNGEFEDLQLMWNMYPTPFNMVVAKDSGITSPEDLVGKTVGAGAPGSGSYIMLIDILETYGVNPEDVEIQAMTPEEQDTAFRDGHLDVMTFQAGPGTAWLVDLSRSRELAWINISEDMFNKLAESQPKGYYTLSEIPSGSYEGLEESVETVAANVEWVTTSEIDEETVYNITKTFWENKEEADEMHNIIKTSTLEVAFGSASAPWHPGVIKYLDEKGIDYAPYEGE